MEVIRVRNVQQALPEALRRLEVIGVKRNSRNGPVTMFPEPVTTAYGQPMERVLFWPERDCNPFFHLYESLWMLAGRNDVDSLVRYVKGMANFSDDGQTFHGAYGYRWRLHFELDQLQTIIQVLRANPDDRRCVLGMWDSAVDLGRQGKDFPCNLNAVFQVGVDGRLNMTVNNRSNDIVWGAYGANAVHFSYLLEYVARAAGLPVGRYWQVSTNFHAYEDTLAKVAGLSRFAADAPYNEYVDDPYATGQVEPYPLMQSPVDDWNDDLVMFLDHGPTLNIRDPFFRKVAAPMVKAHSLFKDTKAGTARFDAALEQVNKIEATDWRLACAEWLVRRKVAAAAKESSNA